MSVGTGIEWTDATWNPVVGCTRAGAECDDCYAVPMTYRADRMAAARGVANDRNKYFGLTVLNKQGKRHFNGKVRWELEDFEKPLHWKQGRRVFVNSMSDLFHGGLYGQAHDDAQWKPGEFRQAGMDNLIELVRIIKNTPQHAYQVLTKRPRIAADMLPRAMAKLNITEPLANLWVLTSCGTQNAIDERMPHLYLLDRCAAVLGLSCEPLLEPLDIQSWLRPSKIQRVTGFGYTRATRVIEKFWVIVGCESRGNFVGRFAEGYAEAARGIIAQCAGAGVACFNKQTPVGNRVSGNPAEWAEDLRVREMPGERGTRHQAIGTRGEG